MNIFSVAKNAITVLHHGKSLNNVEGWKNAQALTNLGIAVAAIVTSFVPGLEIPPDVISNVAIAIAGLANWYLVYSTSEKVGINKNDLPDIKLQASSEVYESTLHSDEHKKIIVEDNQRRTDVIPGFKSDPNASWVYKPKVQPGSESKSESESFTDSGFNDK